MAAVDRPAIVAELATLLGADPADPTVVRAVDAAIEYVQVTVEIDELQTSAYIVNALVGFARALYLDRSHARGATEESLFTPEDPWRHWRHYFETERTTWGIA